MKKTAILLMILTIISKVFGFAREIVLSYFYGASNISDAYLISLTIPSVIFGFIGSGISTGYIPMYSKIEGEHGVGEGNRFTNNFINLLIILCTIIVIFGLLYTEEIIRLFASGFQGETLALAVKFTKISLLGMYFTGLISVFSGFLQLKGNFTIPALIGFPLNFFTIIFIFLSYKTNIMALAIGSVVATATQLILLLSFVHKEGYRYKFVFNIKDEHIKNMLYIALPVIIGVSVNQINVLIDRTLASSIVEGGITALNYANRLNGFVQGLFVASISTAMYPMISKMAAEDNMDGLKKAVSEGINLINLLVIPATIGSMIFAAPAVRFLFARGAFDDRALSLTSSGLFYYSIGMIGFGLREILSRAFYSLQDTKTPVINASIAVVINIVLNIILSKFLGIGGLALATSISAIFCTGLLFISLRKKIGSFGMKNITISFIKILFASLLMGLVSKFCFNTLINNISQNLSFILSIGIGVVVYFVIICFMRIEDVDNMVGMLKVRLKELLGNGVKKI